MARSINDFKSSFKVDVARPARFDVTIPVPLGMANYITSGRNLTYRCEQAELPGRTFQTAEKKMGSAPIEKFPYHTNYQEVTMTFIVSDDMNEKIFFDSWMEVINPTMNFNFKYRSDYSVDISINQYDVTNNLTYVSTLIDAYPFVLDDGILGTDLPTSIIQAYHTRNAGIAEFQRTDFALSLPAELVALIISMY